jgi:hypothetical protein
MVHALEESCRVLRSGGVMIDVRPLSVDVPLEVIYRDGSELIGLVDLSPGLKYDLAADQSIEAVIGKGLFSEANLEIFKYTYHWKNYHAMVADFNDNWQDEIIVSEKVLEQARNIYLKKRPDAHLCHPMQMKLAKYNKPVLSARKSER